MDKKDIRIYEVLERWKELPAPGMETERRWFVNDAIWNTCLSARNVSLGDLARENGEDGESGREEGMHPLRSLFLFSRTSRV